jgi:hypothetical protein
MIICGTVSDMKCTMDGQKYLTIVNSALVVDVKKNNTDKRELSTIYVYL